MGHVHLQVGDEHFTQGDKRCDARDESDRDQESAEEFDDSCDAKQAEQRCFMSAEHPKEFLRAMLREQESDDDAKDDVKRVVAFVQEFHDYHPIIASSE